MREQSCNHKVMPQGRYACRARYGKYSIRTCPFPPIAPEQVQLEMPEHEPGDEPYDELSGSLLAYTGRL